MPAPPQKVSLIQAPTPLHRLDRLSDHLGLDLWIKRDDLTGFAMGGNKGRKLEYLIAEALRQGAHAVVSCGAAQSNFIRQLGAACSMFNLECAAAAMALPFCAQQGRPSQPPMQSAGGNVLLDEILSVDLRIHPDSTWEDLYAHAETLALEYEARGKKVFRVPIGGSSALGAYAFYLAGLELTPSPAGGGPVSETNRGEGASGPSTEHRAPSTEAASGLSTEYGSPSIGAASGPSADRLAPSAPIDWIIFASSSGSTQTGLAHAFNGTNTTVLGIACDPEPELTEDFARLSRELSELMGQGPALAAKDFNLDLDWVGPGYGVPSEAGQEALKLMATKEGIFLDPIYSAKAFSGLLGLVKQGKISGRVVFWHTGGTPSLFAMPAS